ncbi:MAG: tetratricopeptide repeat protein [Betaproteobacteria bacterium]
MTQSVGELPTRRLAAVLLADVVGYSRMMERDETATHLRLREVRSAIIDPALARHGGRPVRNKGDDLLVEFASAVEALACAVQIQQALAEDNGGRTPEARMELRIGINLGDILIDQGGDIAGDGVNIAARLQGLAAPGEVMLTRAVREQVRQLKDLRIEDAGEFRVKNIARPIRAYRVLLPAQKRRGWHRLASVLRRRRNALLAATAALLAAALLGVVMMDRLSAPPPLSVGLMPVVADGVDPTSTAAAQQLTRQLPAIVQQELGPHATVVAVDIRPGESTDPQDVGRRYRVRYVARTTLSATGDAVRATAALIASNSRAQLWSATFEVRRVASDPLPPTLIARLANSLSRAAEKAEAEHLAQTAPAAPLLRLLRAQDKVRTGSDDLARLRELAQEFESLIGQRALTLPALVGAAEAWFAVADRSDNAEAADAARQRAEQLTAQAIAAGPTVARAWQARSVAALERGELTSALEAVERAAMLNPYDAETHVRRGIVLGYMARLDEALAEFDTALELAPTAITVGSTLYFRGRTLLLLGRYDAAVENANRAIAFVPEWMDYVVLAAAYAMQGDERRARRAAAELLKRNPRFTLAWPRQSAVIGDERYVQAVEQHLIAGLRRAGIPE